MLILFIYVTSLASNKIFSPSNKIHREVGGAKDLSAPRLCFHITTYIWTACLWANSRQRWYGGDFHDYDNDDGDDDDDSNHGDDEGAWGMWAFAHVSDMA